MPNLPVVGDKLTKKVGPLPVWGYAVAAAGGYLGYKLLTGRGGSDEPQKAALVTATGAPPPDSAMAPSPFVDALANRVEDISDSLDDLRETLADLPGPVSNPPGSATPPPANVPPPQGGIPKPPTNPSKSGGTIKPITINDPIVHKAPTTARTIKPPTQTATRSTIVAKPAPKPVPTTKAPPKPEPVKAVTKPSGTLIRRMLKGVNDTRNTIISKPKPSVDHAGKRSIFGTTIPSYVHTDAELRAWEDRAARGNARLQAIVARARGVAKPAPKPAPKPAAKRSLLSFAPKAPAPKKKPTSTTSQHVSSGQYGGRGGLVR